MNDTQVQYQDQLGHRVHAAMAMLYLFLLPIATAPKDIAFGILLVYSILRLNNTWRCYRGLHRSPLGWVFALWILWHGISLFWSSDPMEGLVELKSFRVVLTPLMLWPLLNRPGRLIKSILAGVFVLNGIQLVQYLQWFGVQPDWNADRLDALLHPSQAGSLCLAAVCWHLCVWLRGRGTLMWFSAIGGGCAALGLIASGSRGALLAAMITLPIMLLVLVLRHHTRPIRAAVIVITTVVGISIVGNFAGSTIKTQVNHVIDEYQAAVVDHDYSTGIGLRIGNWRWAWRFFAEHPIHGIGAGGFRDAVKQTSEFYSLIERFPEKDPGKFARSHAHSMYLHELACKGMIGGLLLFVALMFIIHRAMTLKNTNIYSPAALFVIIGWLIATQFDSYHLNGHLFGLFMFAVAIIAQRQAQEPVQAESG